jgi:DNA-binding beta-propeller fold protein YncE
MVRLTRSVLGFIGALAVVACVLAIVLIVPGRPADTHSLRFDGYIPLPRVKNAGVVSVLDHLTVSGDDLLVASITSGAVYRIPLQARPLRGSADVSVLESSPAAQAVVVDPISHLAFVTRSGPNTVDVFDPRTMRLVRRIPVAADPDAIVYDPSARLLYVASAAAKLATLIDPTSQTAIATIPLGGEPEFAIFDPSTGLIYQNLADTNSVVAVDVAQRSVVQRWPLKGCEMPTNLAIDDVDRRLLIACGKGSKLAVFDLDRRRVVATVPIGFGADSVAYDAQLRRIYVTGFTGLLSIIDQAGPDSYRVADTIRLHLNAHTLTLDPATHRLFVGYSSLAIPPRVVVFTPRR